MSYATDNRTTELLREGLTERGIEWRSGLKGVTFVGDWCVVEYDNGKLAATCEPVLTPEQAIAATLGDEINGETSDGYHTFNELYHHRAVLFSVIVANHRGIAWKSKLHHDGTMYDGMFIVGLDTPWGQASYHYDIDPYWDMFDCEERESAPEWDGHTPDDAIERIGKLKTLGGGKLTAEAVAKWNARAADDPEVYHDDFYDCESIIDKAEPQGADGNLDQSQVDWLRFMPDGWDGTPPVVPGSRDSDDGDSREKIEADIYEYFTPMNHRIYNKRLHGWLDRQAAITERECARKWQHIAEDRDRAEMERDELRRQVSELRELNDSLHAKLERVREVVE